MSLLGCASIPEGPTPGGPGPEPKGAAVACREAAWKYACPQATTQTERDKCQTDLEQGAKVPDICKNLKPDDPPPEPCRPDSPVAKARLKMMMVFNCLKSALEACPRKEYLLCPSEVLDAFSEPLWVDKVEFGMPDWAFQPGLQYRATLVLTFNRAFDVSTLKPQQTLFVTLRGARSGQTAMNISGTIVPQGDGRTFAFISNEDLADLISPQAAENIVFNIAVVGTDVGNGAVSDLNGEALDGDKDNLPGGDFRCRFPKIGHFC